MSDTDNMVLRTIYLPRALDTRLRDFAFRLQMSKAEFMRCLIQEALDARSDRGERSFSEEADRPIDVSEPSRVKDYTPEKKTAAKAKVREKATA